jgi:hypothetical protein
MFHSIGSRLWRRMPCSRAVCMISWATTNISTSSSMLSTKSGLTYSDFMSVAAVWMSVVRTIGIPIMMVAKNGCLTSIFARAFLMRFSVCSLMKNLLWLRALSGR